MEINLKQASLIIKSVLNIYKIQPEELKKDLPDIRDIITELEKLEKKEIIEQLERTIHLLNEFYYKHDKPLVEDDIYDTLKEDFLEILDPDNKLLQKVGEDKSKEETEKLRFFPESKHEIVAGSQNKVKYSEKEKFEEQIKDFNTKVTISDKMDGITLVTTYTKDKEKGRRYIKELFEKHLEYVEKSNKNKREKTKLKEYILSQKEKILKRIEEVKEENYFPYKIITRGDGEIGEDRTINAIDMKGVVFEINKNEIETEEEKDNIELIIRSEAVIKFEDFESMPYKNPRNGVAALSNQLGKFRDKITTIPFEKIIHNTKTDELTNPDREEMFEWLKKQGFENPYYETFTDSKEMRKSIEKRLVQRTNGEIPYLIDGLVLSIDSAEIREEMGMVGKKPKGEFAFKPDPERAIGEIEEIEFTVGKTGNITPVAKFKEPVPISGSEITFVSLANENIMKEISPEKGSLVEVVKRGEVIPKIEKNLKTEPITQKIEELIVEKIIENKKISIKQIKEVNKKYQEGELHKLFNKNIKKDLKTTIRVFLKELLGEGEFDKLIENGFEEIINDFVEKNKNNKIIEEVEEKRIKFIKNCPSCGSELSKDGEVLIKCLSKNCRGKHIAQLTFFAQNLTKEIGEGKIKQLYDLGMLKTYADFFKIKKDDFKKEGEYIEGWSDRSIDIFINAVNSIKNSQDKDFFASLFFENIGSTKFLGLFQKISFEEMKEQLFELTEKIPEEYSEISSTEKFIKKLEEDNYEHIKIVKEISKVEGWGAIGITRLINLFIEEKEELKELLSIINLKATEKVKTLDKQLSIVITGSIDYIPEYIEKADGSSKRKKLTNYIKSLGHKCPGSVSKTTTCLVSDDVSTTGKFEKAIKLGIPILTSEKFIEEYGNILNTEIKKEEKIVGKHP